MAFMHGLPVHSTCLVAFAVLLLVLGAAQTSRADVKQKLYLIQGHKIESELSAASQLRNYLSANLSPHQRCQRFAILLNAYQRKKSTLTSFQIADIGMLKREEVGKRFNDLDIETLRDLYINGIQKSLEAKQVDGATTELYKCLSTGFRSRDAKARTFLNNQEIKQIIDQYDSIVEQPAKLLTETDHAKHPSLKLEDLHPTVRASVAQLYPDKVAWEALEILFESKERHAHPATERPAAAAAAAAKPNATAATTHAQANATVTPAGAAGAPAVEVEDDDAYLGYVFGSIIGTYEEVPLETSLSERCRAYSQAIEAEREDLLRESYVSELVKGVTENLGKNVEPFVPDETKRENFMFVLQTVDPLQGGHEAWTDMVDCVGQWESVDPEAAAFMHSPELAQTFEQMLALTGETAPIAADPVAQAEAAAATAAAAGSPIVRNAPAASQPKPVAPHVAPK